MSGEFIGWTGSDKHICLGTQPYPTSKLGHTAWLYQEEKGSHKDGRNWIRFMEKSAGGKERMSWKEAVREIGYEDMSGL